MEHVRARVGAGAVVTALTIAAVFALPLSTRAFLRMFRDFGATLPWLTRLFLEPWVPIALGIVPAGILGYALVAPAPALTERRRRILVALAFVIAVLIIAACAYAMYLPRLTIASP